MEGCLFWLKSNLFRVNVYLLCLFNSFPKGASVKLSSSSNSVSFTSSSITSLTSSSNVVIGGGVVVVEGFLLIGPPAVDLGLLLIVVVPKIIQYFWYCHFVSMNDQIAP